VGKEEEVDFVPSKLYISIDNLSINHNLIFLKVLIRILLSHFSTISETLKRFSHKNNLPKKSCQVITFGLFLIILFLSFRLKEKFFSLFFCLSQKSLRKFYD